MDLWGMALALVTEAQDEIQKSRGTMTLEQKLAVAQDLRHAVGRSGTHHR
jgi:hypothetical protein